jgi:hypothetical protein
MKNTIELDKELTHDGGYLEYSKAANPLACGSISQIPIVQFPASLHASGSSRIIPLDISQQLGTPAPASSASLLASFIRINATESLAAPNRATSNLMYAISGQGLVRFADTAIPYQAGDLITLPCGPDPILSADSDSVLYWVNDQPLLTYLGVCATEPRFKPSTQKRNPKRPWPKLPRIHLPRNAAVSVYC